MNSAPPGEVRAPRAADAERVRREVARLGRRVRPRRCARAGSATGPSLVRAYGGLLVVRPTAGIEPLLAGQVDREFSFVPLPGDLAAHAGKATARSIAKNTEYPPAHLQLAGSPWPWRPTTLFALAIAATGVALLLTAVARRHRR